ncbi:hypothetical protein [Gordonia sputi]|uniref:hypothetical protein n=1 Tax=Gordonia sputi TaxID=36823 RepID=UPI0036AFCAB9
MRFTEIFGAVAGEISPDPVFESGSDGKARRVPGRVAVDDAGRPTGSLPVAVALPGGLGLELASVQGPLSVLEAAPAGLLAHVRIVPDGDALIGEFGSRRESFDATLRISGVGKVEVLGDLSTAGRPSAPAAKAGA